MKNKFCDKLLSLADTIFEFSFSIFFFIATIGLLLLPFMVVLAIVL